jgi:hypothetical protein
MARVGQWQESQLEAAIEKVVAGASYEVAEKLTGVPRWTVREHVVRWGIVRKVIPGAGRWKKTTSASSMAAAIDSSARLPEVASAMRAGVSALRRGLADHRGAMTHERKRRDGSLTASEREGIRFGIEHGESDTSIAERLGRHRSTVWREIVANGGREAYCAVQAEQRAAEVVHRPKTPWIEDRPWLWEEVQRLLRTKKWSPEQIAHRLKKDHPDQPEWWVSHETIYQAIFVQAKGELRKELAACLRSGRARRRPRTRASSGRGQIVGMVNISERPAETADRAVPGHWESQWRCQAAFALMGGSCAKSRSSRRRAHSTSMRRRARAMTAWV